MPLLIFAGIVVVGYYIFVKQSPAVGVPAGVGVVPGVPTIYARGVAQQPGTDPPGSVNPIVGGGGVSGPNTSGALIGTGASAGTGLATMAASTAGITALGAATLGIGAAVGAGLALWAAHEARVRGATNENEALGVIMPDFNAAIQAEFQNLNAGQITPNTAYNDLETIRQSFWQRIAPFQSGPGQHTHPCTTLSSVVSDYDPKYPGLPTGRPGVTWPYPGCSPRGSGNTVCDSSCTAGCCIGCDQIDPVICSLKSMILAGRPASFTVPPVVGTRKYGWNGVSGFTISYNPPQVQ